MIGIALALTLATGCSPRRPIMDGADLLAIAARAQRGLDLAEQRRRMVARIREDVQNAASAADTPAFERALSVIGDLPRERFVLRSGRRAAYVDLPQTIGHGQTIADPYVVAIMTGALDLSSDPNVLEVGTGSGYQAAVLSRIAHHVSSVEIVKPLANSAAARLKRMGFVNVDVRAGDGFLGWPEHAPFDGIVVTASAVAVPRPLLDQLEPGGRLIMPVGATQETTQLLRITKARDGTLERCSLGPAMFVPLTGKHTAPFARYGLIDRSIPFCFGRPVVSIF